ncbi:MAG: YlbF family regulator [FCB group bacterium]|nr:YlbF family regulator [FCB group bacterium]
MEKLIEMATELGKALAAHQRTVDLKSAQKALKDDKQASELLDSYHKQAERITNLEKEQKPIEVDDKHKLRDIEMQLSSNEILKSMTKRQVDFVEMMNKVKTAIDSQLDI